MKLLDKIGLLVVGIWLIGSHLYLNSFAERRGVETDQAWENWYLVNEGERNLGGGVSRLRPSQDGFTFDEKLALALRGNSGICPVWANTTARLDGQGGVASWRTEIQIGSRTKILEGAFEDDKYVVTIDGSSSRRLRFPVQKRGIPLNAISRNTSGESTFPDLDVFVDFYKPSVDELPAGEISDETVDIYETKYRTTQYVYEYNEKTFDVYFGVDDNRVVLRDLTLDLILLRVSEKLGRVRLARIESELKKVERPACENVSMTEVSELLGYNHSPHR